VPHHDGDCNYMPSRFVEPISDRMAVEAPRGPDKPRELENPIFVCCLRSAGTGF
jgi:hypothetical protein